MNDPGRQGARPEGALSPPDSRPSGSGRGRNHTGGLVILLCFFCLLGTSAAVLYLLPETQNDTHPAPVQPTPSAAPKPVEQVKPAVSSQPAASELGRAEAEASLDLLLQLKIRAEAEGISRWGEESYHHILSVIEQGDVSFGDNLFSDAADSYRSAGLELEKLLGSKQERFERLLDDAKVALDQGQVQQAALLFDRALAINPAHEQALQYRQRALTRETVLNLYGQAQELEQIGNLREAAGKLEELLELDNSYQPGLSALTRIDEILKNQQLSLELGAFYDQLESGALGEARKTLESLNRLKPEHPQVKQATLVLVEEEEGVMVMAMRTQAQRQVKAEKWQDALTTYQAILARAPEALFALNGREEAAKRLELDRGMVDILSQPQRLQDTAQRQAAEELLRYASLVSDRGIRLQSQIAELRLLVGEAGKDISVTIESDNQTDITIYHVGQMGHFFSRDITLKPGTYTVVGSRMGYRDTRKTIEIDSKTDRKRFIILCNEPI